VLVEWGKQEKVEDFKGNVIMSLLGSKIQCVFKLCVSTLLCNSKHLLHLYRIEHDTSRKEKQKQSSTEAFLVAS
jgi:hypothetical protein